MVLLNILQHSDGNFAWDNTLIVLLAIIAGYLLHAYTVKSNNEKKFKSALGEHDARYKRLENEFKTYKSNINAGEKHGEKELLELRARVKSLEGDIRALSSEKNKFHDQLDAKDKEIRNYSKLIGDSDDRLKALQEEKSRSEAELAAKLKSLKEDLIKASAWEHKVKAAEEDAQRARAAIGNAERKKLEAELRLKATADYAGKVGPLENELSSLKEKYAVLDEELHSKSNAAGEADQKFNEVTNENSNLRNTLALKDTMITGLKRQLESAEDKAAKLMLVSAEMELSKQNITTLNEELAARHAAFISMSAEIELLKQNLPSGQETKSANMIDENISTINNNDLAGAE
jgi:chromosome segregation ATPase